MLSAAASGFVLGLTLIIAIGAQNAFILRQGLMRSHVFVLCLTCAVSDALLIAIGVAGLGGLVERNPSLVTGVTLGGIVFLSVYGIFALRRAFKPSALLASERDKPMPLSAALATCLAFTFLNPHVYLDTVVLLGGLSGRYPDGERIAFGAGAMTASFAWFFSLGYGARLLAPVFAKPQSWRVLDLGIAGIMFALAAGLLVSL